MKYNVVLFDLDGTLLDTLADLTDAVNVTMRKWDKPEVDFDTVRRSLGHGAGHLLARAAGVDDDADIVKDMKEFYTQLEKESDAKILTEKLAKDAEIKALKEVLGKSYSNKYPANVKNGRKVGP